MNEINYKSKLEGFISSLNILLRDVFMFPDQNNGEFVFTVDDVNVDGDNVSFRINLIFSWRGKELIIYNHSTYDKIIDKGILFQRAYFEILKYAFIAQDSVGRMKDSFGNDFNTLSFQTLFTSGLKKIYDEAENCKK